MSMMLMVKAMQTKVGNPLRKLVLIKLADNASDCGECWPSYQHIADQCEMSHSSVRKHIKDLSNAGLLQIENRTGPKGNSSNVYRLTLSGMPSESTPMSSESTPYAVKNHTPMPSENTRTSHSLEPVIEPINKPKDNSAKKTGALDFSCWPYPASEQVFNDWVQLRKAKKAPITQTVVNQVGKELTKAVESGWTVDDVLTETISSGWSKVCFAWVAKNQNSSKGFNADKARSQIGSFLND